MNVYDKVTQYGLYGLLEGTNRQSNGDTFFVDSASGSNATGYGGSWDAPYTTVNYAVAQCTSNNGDVILVAAGHAETITATSTASGVATGQFCIDKAGVTILGMGRGTKRPTFTMTTAAAAGIKIVGTATNVTLSNLLFISQYTNGITAGIAASANCYGLTIENCEFRETLNSQEFLIGITLAANMEDVTIRGCKFFSIDGGTDTAAIKTAGDADRLQIYDNWFRGDWSAPVLDLDAAAIYDVLIRDNIINNVDSGAALQIGLNSSSTGAIINNIIHTAVGGSAIAAAACMLANNLITHTEGTSAKEDKMLAGPGGTTAKQGVFYCDDGGSDSNDGLTWATAVATIGTAIDLCVADNGDTIYVGANHAQTITGAGTTTEFDVDCNGISIIGMGNGNDRPTFTMDSDTANANCYVTGVDCKLENLRFICAETSLENLIDVNAAGLQIINCEFLDDGTDEPLNCITCDTTDDTGGSRLVIRDCRFDMGTGDCDYGIYINKDIHDIVIENNIFRGEYDAGCIVTGSASHQSTNWRIINNYFENETSAVPAVILYPGVLGLVKDNVFVGDIRDEICGPGSCLMVNNIWGDIAGNAGAVRSFQDPAHGSGEIFFVDSGATRAADQVGNGQSWDEPFATLDYAIAFCTASSGAEIHLAPGHSEVLETPGALTIDVVGVNVIGHGVGTDRPTFTLQTGTDSTVVISAANTYLENIIFICDQDALVVGLVCTAAHTTIKNCVFRDLGTDNTLNWITVSATADYFMMDGCICEGTDTAGNTAFIEIDQAAYPTIKNTQINGDFSDGCITFTTGASTDILIENCTMENKNAAIDSCIQGIAGLTGWVRNCSFFITGDAETTWFESPGNTGTFECYGVNNNGESGKFVGTVSA